MGKKFVINRTTEVKEQEDPSGWELFWGCVIWGIIIMFIIKGCGG